MELQKTPLMIHLGSETNRKFYPATEKAYTEIQKDKMPYQVLKILTSDKVLSVYGFSELKLNSMLLEIRPDLAVDNYGYSTSLVSLLSDFERADLVTYDKAKTRILITDLGREFLKNNVIENKDK